MVWLALPAEGCWTSWGRGCWTCREARTFLQLQGDFWYAVSPKQVAGPAVGLPGGACPLALASLALPLSGRSPRLLSPRGGSGRLWHLFCSVGLRAIAEFRVRWEKETSCMHLLCLSQTLQVPTNTCVPILPGGRCCSGGCGLWLLPLCGSVLAHSSGLTQEVKEPCEHDCTSSYLRSRALAANSPSSV